MGDQLSSLNAELSAIDDSPLKQAQDQLAEIRRQIATAENTLTQARYRETELVTQITKLENGTETQTR